MRKVLQLYVQCRHLHGAGVQDNAVFVSRVQKILHKRTRRRGEFNFCVQTCHKRGFVLGLQAQIKDVQKLSEAKSVLSCKAPRGLRVQD